VRPDKRSANELRNVKLKSQVNRYAEGSCLIEMGNTHVLCTASIENKVPHFLKNSGKGWLTAEYAMLPRSCHSRIPRDSSKGKVGGRSQEIQRLIGRSLRAVVDLGALGERTLWMDCDVLQGDGGTRCAAITGAYVALVRACQTLVKKGELKKIPVRDQVAAVSVGIVKGKPILDLSYEEDFSADVDMNIIMTGKGQFVEVQGTAEHQPFNDSQMKSLITLAKSGIRQLLLKQKKVLK
jgi:ribonuclease PH